MANIALAQSPLAVTGDAFHYIDGKSHKMELKSSYNYSTNRIKFKSRH